MFWFNQGTLWHFVVFFLYKENLVGWITGGKNSATHCKILITVFEVTATGLEPATT